MKFHEISFRVKFQMGGLGGGGGGQKPTAGRVGGEETSPVQERVAGPASHGARP